VITKGFVELAKANKPICVHVCPSKEKMFITTENTLAKLEQEQSVVCRDDLFNHNFPSKLLIDYLKADFSLSVKISFRQYFWANNTFGFSNYTGEYNQHCGTAFAIEWNK